MYIAKPRIFVIQSQFVCVTCLWFKVSAKGPGAYSSWVKGTVVSR